MRKIGMAIGAAALALALTACDVRPGGACDQEGSTHVNDNGYSYTCRKVPGGNTIWQQDKQLDPDRP